MRGRFVLCSSCLLLGLVLITPPRGLQCLVAADKDDKKVVSFEKDIQPILEKRCYQCHSEEAKKTKGGLDVSTYAKFMKGGQRGSPVVAGKSGESIIIKFLDRSEKPYMPPPPEEPSPIEEILLFEKWINQGAKK